MYHHLFKVFAVGAAALTIVLGLQWLRQATSAHVPQSMDEVVAIAERHGLFYQYDGLPCHCCLIVSENPVTADFHIRLNNPHHPAWCGTVAIYDRGILSMMPNYDPACSADWGGMFVYGDPVLIEKLVGGRVGTF